MKTNTIKAQNVIKDLDHYISTMKKAQGRLPARLLISKKAAEAISLDRGDKYLGLPVVTQ